MASLFLVTTPTFGGPGGDDDDRVFDRPDADYFGARIDLVNLRLATYSVPFRAGLHLFGRYDKFYGKLGFQMPYFDRAGFDGEHAGIHEPKPSHSGYLMAGYTIHDHEIEKKFRMLDENETPQGVDPHVQGSKDKRFNLELGFRAGLTHYRLPSEIKGKNVQGGKVADGPIRTLQTRNSGTDYSTDLNYAFLSMGLSHTIFRNMKAKFTPGDSAETAKFKRFYLHGIFSVVNDPSDIYYKTIRSRNENVDEAQYVRYQLDDVASEVKYGGRFGYSVGSLKGIGINWNFEMGVFPGLGNEFFNFYLGGSFQLALTRILGEDEALLK